MNASPAELSGTEFARRAEQTRMCIKQQTWEVAHGIVRGQQPSANRKSRLARKYGVWPRFTGLRSVLVERFLCVPEVRV